MPPGIGPFPESQGVTRHRPGRIGDFRNQPEHRTCSTWRLPGRYRIVDPLALSSHCPIRPGQGHSPGRERRQPVSPFRSNLLANPVPNHVLPRRSSHRRLPGPPSTEKPRRGPRTGRLGLELPYRTPRKRFSPFEINTLALASIQPIPL